ncbi:hypothetical protein [Polynucleobacter necessarius]|uniref:hypothetical protein n=1 Tax=Polynucleobacter necessarius TaxID=576610 RepID=UPI000E09C6E5|nr:hypothetical protein [Polynucleobacter necessarius]
MMRYRPLLGTFVEVSAHEDNASIAIEHAFSAIQKIHNLMGFHNPQSELSRINYQARLKALEIHP